MHPGQGPGLSLRDLGEIGGTEAITLLISEIPVHTHIPQVSTADATTNAPQGNVIGKSRYDDGQGGTGQLSTFSAMASPLTGLSGLGLALAGGDLPHNNMQPYLMLNYCIALQGVFPPRS